MKLFNSGPEIVFALIEHCAVYMKKSNINMNFIMCNASKAFDMFSLSLNTVKNIIEIKQFSDAKVKNLFACLSHLFELCEKMALIIIKKNHKLWHSKSLCCGSMLRILCENLLVIRVLLNTMDVSYVEIFTLW